MNYGESKDTFRVTNEDENTFSNNNKNLTQDVNSILKNSKAVFPRESNLSEYKTANVSDYIYGAK